MNISIDTHNHTPSQSISQENYFTSLDIALSSKIFKELFQLQGNGNHPTIAIVMDELLFRENVGKSMTFSQQTIATKVGKITGKGLTRLQAGKILRELEEYGAITRLTPHHANHTYTPNPIFKDTALRLALKHLLPELDDKRISKRKREGDEICAMKAAKIYWSQSFKEEALDLSNSNYDFEAHQQKMHHSLRGINIIENLSTLESEFECDDGALVPYVAFDFDSEPTFLVAATEPIGSFSCIPKKNNQENHKTTNSVTSFSLSSPPSPNNLFKSSEAANLKKGTGMENNLYEQIIPVAASLKSIRPTKWGQIKLSAFSDEAILYADSRMLKTATIVADKFKYMLKICKLHSDEHQLSINYNTMIELGAKHKMGDVHIWLDESFIPVKQAAKPKYATNPTHQSSSITLQEAAARNKAMIELYAPCLLENKQPKQTIQLELEELKTTNPVAYERRIKYAHDLRIACGRDPITGDALPHFDEKIAAKVLNRAFNADQVVKSSNSMQILQPTMQLAQNSVMRFDYGLCDDTDGVQFENYESDPFGDRL